MEFNRIITLLRKERGITQKQAAQDLGISQAQLSHYEKGIRECGLEFVVQVADYYNVSCDYLLGRSAERSGQTIRVEDLPDTASPTDSIYRGSVLEPVAQEIRRRFGNSIYTEDEKVPLETALVELLKKKKLTIATAESCTGGMVSARLVNVPGASQVFMQGMATYSNEAKMRLLGVREETLKEYGAVSEQTAREMAKGGAAAAQTDVCVSITGLAGPGGGSLQKPVGLVFMACCLKGQVTVERWQFKGNREKIREQSVMKAMDLVRRCILDFADETAELYIGKEEDS